MKMSNQEDVEQRPARGRQRRLRPPPCRVSAWSALQALLQAGQRHAQERGDLCPGESCPLKQRGTREPGQSVTIARRAVDPKRAGLESRPDKTLVQPGQFCNFAQRLARVEQRDQPALPSRQRARRTRGTAEAGVLRVGRPRTDPVAHRGAQARCVVPLPRPRTQPIDEAAAHRRKHPRTRRVDDGVASTPLDVLPEIGDGLLRHVAEIHPAQVPAPAEPRGVSMRQSQERTPIPCVRRNCPPRESGAGPVPCGPSPGTVMSRTVMSRAVMSRLPAHSGADDPNSAHYIEREARPHVSRLRVAARGRDGRCAHGARRARSVVSGPAPDPTDSTGRAIDRAGRAHTARPGAGADRRGQPAGARYRCTTRCWPRCC